MNIPPILQTLANEKKILKRNREEGSNFSMDTTNECFELRKRPKLNPVSEQNKTLN